MLYNMIVFKLSTIYQHDEVLCIMFRCAWLYNVLHLSIILPLASLILFVNLPHLFFLSSSQPKEGAFVANPQGPEGWDLRSITALSGWLRCFYRRKGELPSNMPIRSNKCCGKESCLHFILKAVLLNLVHLVYTQDLPWVESDPQQG